MAYRPDYALDIESIVASKGGKLPRFVTSFLRRLLHLDFLNTYFVQGYEGVDFCVHAMEFLDVKLDVEGLENVPADGRYTFVSNHPLGGIDGVALGGIVGQNFGGKVKYLVNDFLMLVKGLAPICVGINKTGGQGRDLPRLIDEAFRSDNQMVLFPAGLCSRKIDGKVQDLKWTKAFVTKSIQTGRDIVPVHFIAENSPRFYRVANLCKRLKLKLNIAMAFLPDEMCRQQHKTFKVVFGKPVPYSSLDSSKTAVEWAQVIRKKVYELN